MVKPGTETLISAPLTSETRRLGVLYQVNRQYAAAPSSHESGFGGVPWLVHTGGPAWEIHAGPVANRQSRAYLSEWETTRLRELCQGLYQSYQS
jgi:hypothetical protein